MASDAAEAVHNAHVWFETNSGWAPPDAGTLAEWMADGVCRCPDECLVAPEGWCEHGLASWWLVLSALDQDGAGGRMRRADAAAINEAHRRAVEAGEPGYADPSTGLFVMTAAYLLASRYCCEQGCRHCPF
jgi:hypothetical protein